METKESVSCLVALVAGFLSFVSPCVLPLIPAYLSFVTGLSLSELTASDRMGVVRRATMLNSICFISGFSTVFIALGISASLLGQFLLDHQWILTKVGGALIVFFGLFISGLLPLNFLYREKRVHLKSKPAGYLGSLLVGSTFALGWTPCVGPILSAILLQAGATGKVSSGITLLGAYSLGLGVPFFLSSLALNAFLCYLDRARRLIRLISLVSGIFLILVGILIFTDYFRVLSNIVTHRLGFRGI